MTWPPLSHSSTTRGRDMKQTARIESHATVHQKSTVISRLCAYGSEHRSITANETEHLPVARMARAGFETQRGH
jgi:hypothetical protein